MFDAVSMRVVDGFECKLGVIDQASDLSAQGASSGISQTKMGRNASHVMSIHQLIVGMVTRDSTGATKAWFGGVVALQGSRSVLIQLRPSHLPGQEMKLARWESGAYRPLRAVAAPRRHYS